MLNIVFHIAQRSGLIKYVVEVCLLFSIFQKDQSTPFFFPVQEDQVFAATLFWVHSLVTSCFFFRVTVRSMENFSTGITGNLRGFGMKWENRE
ncbi:MAG: hypothetical protein D3922_00740 [Candidatus Electrothrix sp. AR1]|nr:hypothetical protein [Candidatus Electrothrix sp. AR1]